MSRRSTPSGAKRNAARALAGPKLEGPFTAISPSVSPPGAAMKLRSRLAGRTASRPRSSVVSLAWRSARGRPSSPVSLPSPVMAPAISSGPTVKGPRARQSRAKSSALAVL